MKRLLYVFFGIYFLLYFACTTARTTTLVYYEVGAPEKTTANQEQIYNPSISKKAYSGYDRPKPIRE